MGLLIMGGRFANLLTRGTVTSSDESDDFPLADAFDGNPGTSFQHVSEITGLIVVDGDLSLGTGLFNDVHVGGAPPGWEDISQGPSATLFRDVGFVSEGASSLRLQAIVGSDIPAVRRDFLCRAGEELTLSVDISGNGGNTTYVYVRDMETGYYLDSDGVWQPTLVAFTQKTSIGYVTAASTFRMSSLIDWPEAVRRVRFEAYAIGGNGWLDNFKFFPSWDTLGIFGHNVRPISSLTLQTATAASGPWTTQLTPTRKAPSFYGRTASLQAKQFTRLNLSGENVEAPWYGEVVVGQSTELPCAMTPVQTIHTDHRIMIPRFMGGYATRGISAWPRLTKRMTFQIPDVPETVEAGLWKEFEAEFLLRQLGGTPTLLVPNTDRSEVLYGHCSPSIAESDGAPGQAGFKKVEAVQFDELAVPAEMD